MADSVFNQIKENWDKIAKPLDSMGKFEGLIAKIGQIQNSVRPKLSKICLLVFCADNGIVEEGVSQSSSEVTATCAGNIAEKKSSAGVMAQSLGIDVRVIDVGMKASEKIPLVYDRKIRQGSRNFIKEAAMTEDEVKKALQTGKEFISDCKKEGCHAVCIGEMGIGNTTTSAAVAASLLHLPAKEAAGRGAGLSDRGLLKKISVIERAIKKYSLYDADVYRVLQAVGGYDIAAMTGAMLGAMEEGMPLILAGLISQVAALCASKMNQQVLDYLIPSHKSREPLSGKINLGLDAVIDADMALGEGSGALMMAGLLRTALAVYDNALLFENSGVGQYKRNKD